MKKETAVLIFLIIVISALIIIQSTESIEKTLENKEFIKENKNLENGDAIVTNIWIDELEKVNNLKEHEIKYLIVDVGSTTDEGKIDTPDQEIKDFIKIISDYEKGNNYNFIMLAYSEINAKENDIFTNKFENNFIEDYSFLVSSGFDGLLIDIEQIPFDKRGNYIDFLERVYNSMGKNGIIAVYSGHLGNDDSNEWVWNTSFYQDVSNRVDIISVPGYDLDLETEKMYKTELSKKIQTLDSLKLNSKLFFGVPTHKPPPETISNALEVYYSEVEKNPDNNFLGIAVFAEWITDDKEWETFDFFKQKNFTE